MKFRTIGQLIIKYQKTPLPGNYNSNNIQTSKPMNAAMPANTSIPMFQTSCETEMHMKIWLIVNYFV